MIKKRKKSKTNHQNLINPMHMTEALKEFGESVDKKTTFLFYGVMFLIALYLSVFFELNPFFIVCVIAVYVLVTPQLIYNQKKHSYEIRRFHDINAYMSQMAQIFTDSQDVINSLKETSRSFTEGRMNDTLKHALDIIDKGKSDIRKAEREALTYIEERYNCEKVRNLHSFILSAEEIGGECSREFYILENIRGAWKEAVIQYHQQTLKKRNYAVTIYGVLLLLCIFMLNVMREEGIDVIENGFIQFVNAMLISIFLLFFTVLDKRLNESLLKDFQYMTEEKALRLFTYINNFNSSRERRKNIVYGIVSVVIAGTLFIYKKDMVALVVGAAVVFVGFNVHKILLIMRIRELKKELRRAFPMWLFDIMLLIQRESVEGAIEQSVDTAPPVIKNEVQRISNLLRHEPHNPDAYLSFFADFNNLDIEEAMRKLYALSIGTGGNGDVMGVIIKSNMTILEQAERERLQIKGEINISGMLPILVIGFGFIAYIAMMFVDVISNLLKMFG